MLVLTYRPGDVLRWTDRLGLDHDAVADDQGFVIHQLRGAGVVRQRIGEFDPEGGARVVDQKARRYDHGETLRRAQAALGRPGYNLLFDNCQHFAAWCATGERKSHQVEAALLVAGAAAGVASLLKITALVGIAVAAGAAVAYLAGNAAVQRLAPREPDATAVVIEG